MKRGEYEKSREKEVERDLGSRRGVTPGKNSDAFNSIATSFASFLAGHIVKALLDLHAAIYE
jgi:hypothetical protein